MRTSIKEELRMPRLVRVSFVALVLSFVLAVPAEATCFKCRQDTGGSTISCYMSEGTKAWCEPVGSSGCFSGGSCGGGNGWDCDTGGPCEQGALRGTSDERVLQCEIPDRVSEEDYVVAEVIVFRARPRVLVAALAR